MADYRTHIVISQVILQNRYNSFTLHFRTSERQVMVYRVNDLQEVHTVPLDVSPTILIPYYDQDSNTLFVTGKVCIWFN